MMLIIFHWWLHFSGTKRIIQVLNIGFLGLFKVPLHSLSDLLLHCRKVFIPVHSVWFSGCYSWLGEERLNHWIRQPHSCHLAEGSFPFSSGTKPLRCLCQHKHSFRAECTTAQVYYLMCSFPIQFSSYKVLVDFSFSGSFAPSFQCRVGDSRLAL